MSKQHDRITGKLREQGAAWAVRSDKFVGVDDPGAGAGEAKPAYHIHPNASYPHQAAILLFYSLAELEDWLDTRKIAATLSDEQAEELMGRWYAAHS